MRKKRSYRPSISRLRDSIARQAQVIPAMRASHNVMYEDCIETVRALESLVQQLQDDAESRENEIALLKEQLHAHSPEPENA